MFILIKIDSFLEHRFKKLKKSQKSYVLLIYKSKLVIELATDSLFHFDSAKMWRLQKIIR